MTEELEQFHDYRIEIHMSTAGIHTRRSSKDKIRVALQEAILGVLDTDEDLDDAFGCPDEVYMNIFVSEVRS